MHWFRWSRWFRWTRGVQWLRGFRRPAQLLLLTLVVGSARVHASARLPTPPQLQHGATIRALSAGKAKPIRAGRAAQSQAAAATLPKSIAEQFKEGQSAPWAIVVGLTLLTVLP